VDYHHITFITSSHHLDHITMLVIIFVVITTAPPLPSILGSIAADREP
jgi:hypothetical protein